MKTITNMRLEEFMCADSVLTAVIEIGSSDEKREGFNHLISLAMTRFENSVQEEVAMPIEANVSLAEVNSRLAGAIGGRFGNWFEYGLSFHINSILNENNLQARCFPVISHEFCDLEIRRLVDGELTIRLEVKTVDPMREESVFNIKEAVGRTYINRDYIIVMSWRFSQTQTSYGRPVVIGSYVLLDAWSFCILRDQAWFPSEIGAKQSSETPKGWDLLGPVAYSWNDDYPLKGEEGNIGKGWRVSKNSQDIEIPSEWDYVASTHTDLYRFHREVLSLGFEIECYQISNHYNFEIQSSLIVDVNDTNVMYVLCKLNDAPVLAIVSDSGHSASVRNQISAHIFGLDQRITRIVYLKNTMSNTRFQYSIQQRGEPASSPNQSRAEAPWNN